MADPTITWKQRFTSDFTAAAETWEGTASTWTECGAVPADLIQILAGDITATWLHGDIMRITLDCDNAATVESGFYSYPDKDGANNLAIDTTLSPSFLIRYRTSVASAGVAAKVVLAFNGYVVASSVDVNIAAGHAQEIMTNSYSAGWTTAAGTITAGKTLDHILVFAECGTDTANATYWVEYDFAMVHEGTFTFQQVRPGGIQLRMPQKVAQLEIPGRDGDIIQRLGMKSPRIRLEGHMEHALNTADWGSATTGSNVWKYGEYLYYVARGMNLDYREPFCWLTTDMGDFKVVPAPEGLQVGMIPESGVQRTWSMDFLVHSLSSLGEQDWDGLGWANQSI